MKIREDVYTWARTAQKQEILQGLARMSYETFSSLFSSEDGLIQYLNNFENPDIAERFLEIGDFYHYAKFYYCPNCWTPKRIERCPNCDNVIELPAHLVLIIILSITENLSLGLRKYVDFYDWISNREIVKECQNRINSGDIIDFKILVDSLKRQWSNEYGSTTKVTDFFKKFLTKEEKIKIVKSIKYMKKVPELPPQNIPNIEGKTSKEAWKSVHEWEEAIQQEQRILFKTDDDIRTYVKANNNKKSWEALPICFDMKNYWNCYYTDYCGRGHGYCCYATRCRLDRDSAFLEDCLEKTVKTIYDWRSIFVHNAELPPIREKACLGSYYKEKPVIIELTSNDLKPIFEKMLKRYFDEHQKRDVRT